MSVKTRTELQALSETGDTISSSWATDVYDSAPNIANDGTAKYFKVELSYEDFQPEAGASATIAVGAIPAGYYLKCVSPIIRTNFAGSGIGTATISLLRTSDGYDFVSTMTVKTAETLPTISFLETGLNVLTWDPATAQALQIVLTTDGSIDDLSAGAADVYLECVKLPSSPTVLFP